MPEAKYDILLRLATRLTTLTDTGSIEWEHSKLRPDLFRYSATSSSVLLFSQDQDYLRPYVLVIEDSNGVRIETFSTANKESQASELRAAVERLYASIKGSSGNSIKVIQKLLDELAHNEKSGHE